MRLGFCIGGLEISRGAGLGDDFDLLCLPLSSHLMSELSVPEMLYSRGCERRLTEIHVLVSVFTAGQSGSCTRVLNLSRDLGCSK